MATCTDVITRTLQSALNKHAEAPEDQEAVIIMRKKNFFIFFYFKEKRIIAVCILNAVITSHRTKIDLGDYSSFSCHAQRDN